MEYRRVLKLDPRCAAAYSGLGLVEHLLGRCEESIARYHEVRPSPSAPHAYLAQSLSITPGDPLVSDLLKLVLEDISKTIDVNSESLPFPGLSSSTLRHIDLQVEALDRDVMEGRAPGESMLQEGEMSRLSTRRGSGNESGVMEESVSMDQTMTWTMPDQFISLSSSRRGSA